MAITLQASNIKMNPRIENPEKSTDIRPSTE
jgi:hypothetical protein